jgi:hypothetical protein
LCQARFAWWLVHAMPMRMLLLQQQLLLLPLLLLMNAKPQVVSKLLHAACCL